MDEYKGAPQRGERMRFVVLILWPLLILFTFFSSNLSGCVLYQAAEIPPADTGVVGRIQK